jgi:hypothetical protein
MEQVTYFFEGLTFTNLVWDNFGPDAPTSIGWFITVLLSIMYISEIFSFALNYTKSYRYILFGLLYVVVAPLLITIISLQLSVFGILVMGFFLFISWANTNDESSSRVDWEIINGEMVKGHLTLFNIMYSLKVYALRKKHRATYIQNLLKEQQDYLNKYSHITI